MTGKQKTYFIYGLTDPRDGAIRYVGCTTNPMQRFATHCGQRTIPTVTIDPTYPMYRGDHTSHKYQWMRDIFDHDMQPGLIKLDETGDRELALSLEKLWIETIETDGTILYNNKDNPGVVRRRRARWTIGYSQ